MVFSATVFLILDAAATGVKAPTQIEQMFQSMQLPLLLLVAFYFLLIRPQQKQRKEQQKLIGALKTGDKVITSAGIHGMISNVKERTVLLKLSLIHI